MNQEDRELLELAAKAAGYGPSMQSFGKGLLVQVGDGQDQTAIPFQPLTDDGDAFRLAVKLRMTIHRHDPTAVCAGWGVGLPGAPTVDGTGPWYWKEWLRDPEDDKATTRLAIVRAAAEIGRSKP